jgi:DNA repair protein RadC
MNGLHSLLQKRTLCDLMHNHPSGEPQPSEADVKITRDLIRAGQLMKIEVLDHIIMGNPKHCSLRELGHFYS